MGKPTILFLFNSSTYALQPWVEDGRFNVATVDYDATDHNATARGERDSRAHYYSIDLSREGARDAVLAELARDGLNPPSLVVSFAPCTDLAVSGARHFAAKVARDPDCQLRAVRMAMLASRFGCPYAVENPVSVLATLWRSPDFYWHPWEFSGYIGQEERAHPEFPGVIPDADLYYKKSCLWTGRGFVLPFKLNFGPPDEKKNPGWAKLGGKSARTKHIRSLTPRGFARAVYAANAAKVLANTHQGA